MRDTREEKKKKKVRLHNRRRLRRDGEAAGCRSLARGIDPAEFVCTACKLRTSLVCHH